MAIAKLKPLIKHNISTTTAKPVERDRSRAAQKERIRVLSRDGWLCVKCKAIGVIRMAAEVDHIIPLFDGGRDSMANKQSLCVECHRGKGRDEAKRRGRG